MPHKLNSRELSIQSVQKFVRDRISQHPIYESAERSLQDLNELLNTGKLRMQIVSYDVERAQVLQNRLASNPELCESYQFKLSAFPEIPESNTPPPPSLVIQPSSNTQSPISYELNSSEVQIIGRNPTVSQILIPDCFTLVSGSHATLQPAAGDGWQIEDLGSLNGTFINSNSQKLQGLHSLKAGDRICLGSASQAEGSATLSFEIPSIDDNSANYLYNVETQKLLDCNILCLVIPGRSTSKTIQKFIQRVKDRKFANVLILVDLSNEISLDIEKNLNLKLSSLSYELINVELQNFNFHLTESNTHLDRVFQNLRELYEAKYDKIIESFIHQVFDRIEATLVKDNSELKVKYKNHEEKFKAFDRGSSKKEFDKKIKKINEARDLFFKQAKSDLNQSKYSLLDPFNKTSITHKIQKGVQQLKVRSFTQGQYCYVSLNIEWRNIHAEIINFCHAQLNEWATEEWNRIQNSSLGGGLSALFQKSYESLNIIHDLSISDLVMPKDRFSTSGNFNLHSVFDFSIVQPILELRNKQASLLGYILKSLRGQMMVIGGSVAMFGGYFLNKNSGISRELLVIILLPIVVAMLIFSYQQDKQAKIEELTEKLIKETISYYQSYSKGLVDKLMQRLSVMLESEDKHFRGILEEVKEVYASHITELDDVRKQLKAQVEKSDRDLADLRKLKRSL